MGLGVGTEGAQAVEELLHNQIQTEADPSSHSLTFLRQAYSSLPERKKDQPLLIFAPNASLRCFHALVRLIE